MAVPELTGEQRRENLEKAARIRAKRAELRRFIKAGATSIEQVFTLADDGAPEAANMRVTQLVSAMPGYGFAKTRDLMASLGIATSRRVKGLGARQRAALLDVFGGR